MCLQWGPYSLFCRPPTNSWHQVFTQQIVRLNRHYSGIYWCHLQLLLVLYYCNALYGPNLTLYCAAVQCLLCDEWSCTHVVYLSSSTGDGGITPTHTFTCKENLSVSQPHSCITILPLQHQTYHLFFTFYLFSTFNCFDLFLGKNWNILTSLTHYKCLFVPYGKCNLHATYRHWNSPETTGATWYRS